jgi:hypothetical protein
MLYQISLTEDHAIAYIQNKQVGKFDIEVFLTNVISPREFKQFEKDPDKRLFNIRKIEFNIYNLTV